MDAGYRGFSIYILKSGDLMVPALINASVRGIKDEFVSPYPKPIISIQEIN